MELDEIKKLMQEKVQDITESFIPEALNNERLENAFKSPECDEQGYSPSLPAIVDSNIYHNLPNDVKAISYLSATLKSELYSKYLDEEAIVWDTATQELLLYIPDKKHPAVAFKGSRWQYARKLKKEYLDPDPSMRRIQIKRMYSIIKYNIKKEIILKTNSHEKDLLA
jgi:hypothetical protein